MKNIIIPIFALISSFSYAQVIIGDEVGTATNKNSVLLEFSKTQNKGLILPYVKALPTAPAQGTIILDASTPTAAKVKYFNGTWQDLSIDGGNVSTHLTQQPATPLGANTAKVIIGADTSAVDGVLILESTTKAMVLPTVNSTNDIINPAPGMIVYVSNATTNEKLLATFDGKSWSFFAAQ